MMKDVLENKVVVLAGGWSDERDVSLNSAREVRQALIDAGFGCVDLLDVAEQDFAHKLTTGNYDVAFVAMHGRFGEDGSVQGLLEILHIPYTFSGVLASSIAMEKSVTKVIYEKAGLPVADDRVVEPTEQTSQEMIDDIVEELGLPLFVKPVDNGSSFGVTMVTETSELAQAIALAASEGSRVLVESAIEGMEITVPVIGNQNSAEALPIVEIVTGSSFYDTKVKYEPTELHHVIPARLAEDVYSRAQELAIKAHQALGCRGCSRSDFIVTPEGEPYILETNTIPGMTAESILPDSARHSGIAFPDLCRRFVELALEDVR